MSSLTEALNRIINRIQQDEPELFLLQPSGLSIEEIKEIVKNLPLSLPSEIYELYHWSRGFSRKELYENLFKSNILNPFIFDGFALLSLQEAVELYQEKLNDSKYYHEHHMEVYNPNWFEIFICYMGDIEGYVVVDDNRNTCSVISIVKREEIRQKYVDLTSMMLTLAENYEQGYCNSVAEPQKFNEIWQKYNSSLVDVVVEKLTDNISYELLLEIAQDLSNFKDKRTIEPLIHILQKPSINPEDLSRQELAAKILGEIGDSRALEPLISALQSEYWLTRHWAAVSLGMLKDKRAVEGLTNTLQDEYQEVRQMAEWALEQLEQ